MRPGFFSIAILILLKGVLVACLPAASPEEDSLAPAGTYLSSTPPQDQVTLFAPGFISGGMHDRDFAITPDGKEIYYSVFLEAQQRFTLAIFVTRMQADGSWSAPQVAPFSGRYNDVEPCLSVDGEQLVFVSNRPLEVGGEPFPSDLNLWSMHRVAEGWSQPQPLGPEINTPAMEAFPSLTADGTLYFTRNDEGLTRSDIYRSRWVDGDYGVAEKLPPVINAAENPFNGFIAPDESYLIFCAYGTEGSHGGSDYLISFRSSQDQWSAPLNLGPEINSPGKEISPYVTRDGKYFFFASDRGAFVGEGFFNRPPGFADRSLSSADFERLSFGPENGRQDIYWVDTSFLAELKSKAGE